MCCTLAGMISSDSIVSDRRPRDCHDVPLLPRSIHPSPTAGGHVVVRDARLPWPDGCPRPAGRGGGGGRRAPAQSRAHPASRGRALRDLAQPGRRPARPNRPSRWSISRGPLPTKPAPRRACADGAAPRPVRARRAAGPGRHHRGIPQPRRFLPQRVFLLAPPSTSTWAATARTRNPPPTFDKPGVVTLHCEIHEAMRGTILVLDTPYFVKTDAAGRLPARRAARRPFHVLKAWLNEKTTLEHPVDLPAQGVAHVVFPLKPLLRRLWRARVSAPGSCWR